MLKSFIETRTFTKWVTENLTDEAYAEVQRSLMRNPEVGAVISGCGGLRKMRVGLPGRRKGKRGGARIIYLHVPEADWIILLDAYAKGEADDLTAEERRILRRLSEQLRNEAVQAARRFRKGNS